MGNIFDKKIAGWILSLLIVGAAGYWLGANSKVSTGLGNSNLPPLSAPDNDLVKNIISGSIGDTEVYSLAGTILEIKGDTLVVDVPYVLSVAVPPNSDIRKREAVVSADTKFIDKIRKSEKELNAELQNYKPGPGVPPPNPYNLKTISKSSLKVGDVINMQTERVDIKNSPKIEPSAIIRENN